ncbi:carboxypeptidase S [Wolfiporia cocos MD-104 SS10]|uniref:Carboxypeptidase S n=1 Tax=Wolfiporia cocos (strain MD-104) TaxID=742152 RepID=A0A2H3IXS9_WOLCO|nr:carboxypeptidase S [Wolfiporia cocos MD-104 SS10]
MSPKTELPHFGTIHEDKTPPLSAVPTTFARSSYYRRTFSIALRLLLAICCLGVLAHRLLHQLLTPLEGHASLLHTNVAFDAHDVCPQSSALTPSTPLLANLEAEYATEEFRLHAVESLGGTVRIPTQMWDDLKPPGQDARWEIFSELHTYLERRFPLVHARLRKTEVNIYALVYHWQGKDDSLKPLLLAAHQDVVPVEPLTIDQWLQPPFSGYYDGEWIWGRGSCDDKSGLISTLTSVEKLLERGFQPTRTIVLAYGIDEERGGVSGATAIRDYLLEHYGEDAFAMIVDEGGHYTVRGGAIMSSPAVAEKGKFDARLEITAPGGHSSVPPHHTTIGMLASIITEIEANPHTPHLNRSSTYYQQLLCQAAHDPALPAHLKKLIQTSLHSDKTLQELEGELLRSDRMFGPLAGTTQAVDIIHGGVKSNALPENVYLIMNHRIDTLSSVSAVKSHITTVVGPVAQDLNLSVDAFGELYGGVGRSAAFGHLQMSDAYGTALEPAPITPTHGSGPYELLAGTIIGALETSNRTGMPRKAFLAPSLATANLLDTKHYWKLTKHIFRYGHGNGEDHYNGAHTVNEAIKAEGFFEMIRFHTRLILNGHDSSLLD